MHSNSSKIHFYDWESWHFLNILPNSSLYCQSMIMLLEDHFLHNMGNTQYYGITYAYYDSSGHILSVDRCILNNFNNFMKWYFTSSLLAFFFITLFWGLPYFEYYSICGTSLWLVLTRPIFNTFSVITSSHLYLAPKSLYLNSKTQESSQSFRSHSQLSNDMRYA